MSVPIAARRPVQDVTVCERPADVLPRRALAELEATGLSRSEAVRRPGAAGSNARCRGRPGLLPRFSPGVEGSGGR
jgi:hypothetical protein